MLKELWGGALPWKSGALGCLCYVDPSSQGPGLRAAQHKGGSSAGSLPAPNPRAGGLWELLAQGHSNPSAERCLPGQGSLLKCPPQPQDPDRQTFLWPRVRVGLVLHEVAGHHESALSLSKYMYFFI